MKKHTVNLLILACLSLTLSAQHNSDYVQYLFNGLLLNPARAN
ncbi:MAG: hypothetical protein K0S12_2179 [Bacteroidetes bacterium]|nr:hypothetical protein [Bacteroidota bacterium]